MSSELVKRVRGALVLLVGAALTLGCMSFEPNLRLGFALGVAGVLAGLVGTFMLLGAGGVRAQQVVARIDAQRLYAPLIQAAAAVALLTVMLRLAVRGVIPFQPVVLAITMPLAFLWLTLSVGRAAQALGCLEALDVNGASGDPPVWRRQGFWLIAISTAVYLPLLGSFGLVDPWESHYAEVAREVLSRDDWISLWWGDEGWFFSKPILNFWLQASSFLWLGVKHLPDQMILGITRGRLPQPEWAVRLPGFLISLLGQYLLYKGVAAHVGRRRGFLAGLVLCTTPYWYFLARQSMPDMAHVGPLCAAMGLLLLALRFDPEVSVRAYEIALGKRRLVLSAFHLFVGAVVLIVLPQVLYLLSRNVTLQLSTAPYVFLHPDQWQAGSAGNCGLPGNAACSPELKPSALQPALAALLWTSIAIVLLWLERNERRAKSLCYLGAWLLLAVSFMSKGPPAPVIILSVFGSFLVVSGRWSELRRCELGALLLLFACVAMPWFVQEYMRHGTRFSNELLVKDMYTRAFGKVHDTNAASKDDTSFRYYIWQLGYGLFPWTGIIAAGNLWFISRAIDARETDARLRELVSFLVLWELAAFGMFSVSGTKFHHYILPLVPAAAVLGGLFIDELIGAFRASRSERERASIAVSLGVLALGATVLTALVGRDLIVTLPGDVEGQARLIHLFTYMYTRPWPPTLNFKLALAALTVAASVCSLLLLVPRWRARAAGALCVTSLVGAIWGSNVYLPRVSQHWTQRGTVSEYYRRRSGPEELLVAYRLNWKGENFYTGNRIPTFRRSGEPFKKWIREEREKGTRVMFFTTEHVSIGGLKKELGKTESFEVLTDAAFNNKFALARVVL